MGLIVWDTLIRYDDILIFNVSKKIKEQLNTLSAQNNAYLITKE